MIVALLSGITAAVSTAAPARAAVTASSKASASSTVQSAPAKLPAKTASQTDVKPGTPAYPSSAQSKLPELPAASTPQGGTDDAAPAAASDCTATGDTDFSSGPATGSFTSAGQQICLTLPDASGQSLYFFDQPSAAGVGPAKMEVVDSTGAQQCLQQDGSTPSFSNTTCTLSGTAPFEILLTSSDATGQYRVLAQNTASTAGCSDWPQSGTGSSYGATATFTATSTAACFTIPANQHSTGEMVTSTDAGGSGKQAGVSVNDSTGKEFCTGEELIGCSYQVGVDYTAIVVSSTAGTFDLAHRDVSQTASCGTPASTTVGGASTTLKLDSSLDTECYRLSAAATDKLWVNARTSAPDGGYAWLAVTDASGAPACYDGGGSGPCQLTGDTDYQVILVPQYYSGVAVTTHLDTWTVGTASGWASQCTQNHYSAETGWGPVNGTLTENAAGYCATVDVQPGDKFTVYEANASQRDIVTGDVIPAENWNVMNGVQTGFCSGDSSNSRPGMWIDCQVPSSQAAETAVMIVYPGNTYPGNVSNPTPYTLQSLCQEQCAQKPVSPTVSSISSTSGTAGPGNTITVTGTGLNLGDEFSISNNSPASPAAAAQDESVNSAGTSLTVSLDTTGVAAGKYSATLEDQYSNDVSAGSYTVTSAPTPSLSGFTPVTQTQIMSKSLAEGSTTNVGVGGNGGVPSSGATSAKLEITVTNPSTAGSITVYPGSSTKTSTTALNFAAGQTQTDMVDVQLGSGVELYNGAGGALNVTVDTVGYYSSGGASYTPLPEGRILNSTSVASKTTKEINVSGNGGVPSSGASSVALEVTESGAAAAGSAVVYPNGGTRPADGDLSFAKGQSVTEMAIGKLGTGLLVYNNSGGAANFTVNVVGYYSSSDSKFHPITPHRILDTRNAIGDSGNQGVLAGGATRTLLTDGVGIPSNAKAVVVDVTALSPQDAGSLFAFPDNANDPTAGQDLTFSAGGKATGLVVIPLSNLQGQASQTFDVYNDSGGTVQIVGDLEGYYA